MKNPTIALLISLSLFLTLLSGCSANGLTYTEKDLLSVQNDISKEINDFSESLQNSDMDYSSISLKAGQLVDSINEKIKEVKKLGNKLEDNKIPDKTDELLKSAKRIASKLKEVATKLDALQIQSSSEAKQQIEELKKSLNGYKTRLSYYKESFTNLSDKLINPPSEEEEEEIPLQRGPVDATI